MATFYYTENKYLTRVLGHISEGGEIKIGPAGTKKVKIEYTKEVQRLLKDAQKNPEKTLQWMKNNNFRFATKTGELYRWTELFKGTFSARETNSTKKEDAELASLKKQIDEALSKSTKPYIIVKVGNKKYNVAGAESTKGTPKSDFHLLDENGKEVVWISHKDGKSAKDFQQWGGVSTREYSKPPKDVKAFADKIKKMYGGGMPRATTVATEITDPKLKMQAVYGKNYGSGTLGKQNVTIVLQGSVKLIKKSQWYELDSVNTHINGDKITGSFEPVLMAIYKGDRSNFGIKGARFGIMPRESRKVKEWI
jgi:hypothetical protein